MLNKISEIGIHISIQNLLQYQERVNDISRYDFAVFTLLSPKLIQNQPGTAQVGAISKAQK